MKHPEMPVRRYNPDKPGSFQIAVWFYDWELSQLIGLIRDCAEKHAKNKAHEKHLKKIEKKLGKALSKLLKIELADLKGIKMLDEVIE